MNDDKAETNSPEELKHWLVSIRYEDMKVVGCSLWPSWTAVEDVIFCMEGGLSIRETALCVVFLIGADKEEDAVKTAEERMKVVKKLEDTKFPLLREKCIKKFFPLIGEQFKTYPFYNFFTGEISLD